MAKAKRPVNRRRQQPRSRELTVEAIRHQVAQQGRIEIEVTTEKRRLHAKDYCVMPTHAPDGISLPDEFDIINAFDESEAKNVYCSAFRVPADLCHFDVVRLGEEVETAAPVEA